MAANQERDFLTEAADLLASTRVGTLATVSPAGAPHAALVTPALLADGSPLFLFSELSAHTRHLRQNPACALLLTGAAPDENPQTIPRVLLSGRACETNSPAARTLYLQTHPYAERYVDFQDFYFWKLSVNEVQFVGGFAAAAAIEPAALQNRIIARFPSGHG